MTLTATIDEHLLQHYRELLDLEDSAFDELEHAFEDGDRQRFDQDLASWQRAVEVRLTYLRHLGID
jgi:hypothetical protein